MKIGMTAERVEEGEAAEDDGVGRAGRRRKNKGNVRCREGGEGKGSRWKVRRSSEEARREEENSVEECAGRESMWKVRGVGIHEERCISKRGGDGREKKKEEGR